MSLSEAVQTILVILVGYFGRKTHKPRYISVSIVFTGIGCLLTASPYFMFGPKHIDPALFESASLPNGGGSSAKGQLMMSFGNSSMAPTGYVNKLQMCNKELNWNMSDECVPKQQKEQVKEKETYGKIDPSKYEFSILLVASILGGFGMSGLGTLGITYLDENVKQESSALYIGTLVFYSVLPILG